MSDPLASALGHLPHGPEFRFVDRLVEFEPVTLFGIRDVLPLREVERIGIRMTVLPVQLERVAGFELRVLAHRVGVVHAEIADALGL